MQMRVLNPVYLIWILSFALVGCVADSQFDQLTSQNGIPSGSIIITSNVNGTTGPGIVSVWTPDGQLDRVIYDYNKVGTGYASGMTLCQSEFNFCCNRHGRWGQQRFSRSLQLFNALRKSDKPFFLPRFPAEPPLT